MDYHSLITKFLAGEISEAELDQLKDWLRGDPGNKKIFDQENEFWQRASAPLMAENFNTDRTWSGISSRLGFRSDRNRFVATRTKRTFRILMAAASVALLFATGTGLLWLQMKRTIDQIGSASAVISTRQGDMAHIYLPDSTEVLLNSETTLAYNGSYNIKSREISFSGEAYFRVRTDKAKPFTVRLENGMTVKATGTSFNIYSYPNENRIEATLEEGTILVSAPDAETVRIAPGQQAVYISKGNKLFLREVNVDNYLSWKENMLRFDDTPLEDVFRRIGRKYNVKFEVSGPELLDLRFTATFIDESIEDIMGLLRSVSPIDYRIYYRTSVKDKRYVKPKVLVYKRKTGK